AVLDREPEVLPRRGTEREVHDLLAHARREVRVQVALVAPALVGPLFVMAQLYRAQQVRLLLVDLGDTLGEQDRPLLALGVAHHPERGRERLVAQQRVAARLA